MINLKRKLVVGLAYLGLILNATVSHASIFDSVAIYDPVTVASWLPLFVTSYPSQYGYYVTNPPPEGYLNPLEGYSVASNSQVITLLEDFGATLSFVQGVSTSTYTGASSDTINNLLQALTGGDFENDSSGWTSSAGNFGPIFGFTNGIGFNWQYSASSASILNVYDLGQYLS
jgi:hypothetical protein